MSLGQIVLAGRGTFLREVPGPFVAEETESALEFLNYLLERVNVSCLIDSVDELVLEAVYKAECLNSEPLDVAALRVGRLKHLVEKTIELTVELLNLLQLSELVKLGCGAASACRMQLLPSS